LDVFISWSGAQSRQVALALRDWLPGVINAAEPYVSSEDIEKGTRWSADITGKLNSTSIGIICVTRENMNRPWINFEAGALSKAVVDEARVIPMLVDLGNAELVGPLSQFQTVILDKEDLRKLVNTINLSSDKPNPQSVVDRVFKALWPELDTTLRQIASVGDGSPKAEPGRSEKAMLAELIDLTRDIQRTVLSTSLVDRHGSTNFGRVARGREVGSLGLPDGYIDFIGRILGTDTGQSWHLAPDATGELLLTLEGNQTRQMRHRVDLLLDHLEARDWPPLKVVSHRITE
jgi:TIR domain